MRQCTFKGCVYIFVISVCNKNQQTIIFIHEHNHHLLSESLRATDIQSNLTHNEFHWYSVLSYAVIRSKDVSEVHGRYHVIRTVLKITRVHGNDGCCMRSVCYVYISVIKSWSEFMEAPVSAVIITTLLLDRCWNYILSRLHAVTNFWIILMLGV